MSTVEIIIDKIDSVRTDSTKSIESIEHVADMLIDSYIKIKKDIDLIAEEAEKISEDIYSYFDTISSEDYLKFRPQLKNLIRILTLYYAKCRNTSFIYSSNKDIIRKLKSGLDNIKELHSDLEAYKIELANDKEYQDLIDCANNS